MSILSSFISSTGFMPHGHCFLWTPGLLWTYTVSDSLIGLAYYSIPLALWHFVRHRVDLPFTWVFGMFAVFIFACGTTHLMAVWTIWEPAYWLDATIKGVTASASIATAIALWPLIPKALLVPSPGQLAESNQSLQREIAERKEAEHALQLLNQQLEDRITERTAELQAANAALLRQIDERKQAHQALASERTLLRTLIDTLPDVVFAKDTAGRFTMCNAAELANVGVATQTELLGRTVFDFYPQELAALYHADDKEALAGRSVLNREERGMGAEGAPRWFLTTKVPLRGEAGEIVGLVGVSRDITERRLAQANQERAQKLEAMGTLASGVAHDFNNILLAIAGNTKLAMTDLALDHPAQQSLQEIEKASARAADLVRRILTFTRDTTPNRTPTKLEPVVQEALKLLRATLPSLIRIDATFESELPEVLADATQIHQIVMNLGTNAAHAIGRRSGAIAVRLERVSVTMDMAPLVPDLQEGRYLCLTFMDDGCGMNKQTLERIFDPFFTTKAVGEGAGLGLSVVHGIVRSHDGAISVYSIPNLGTTFKLYFPALSTETSSPQIFQSAVPRGSGERILYVDDEESLVLMATRMLRRLGYEVTGYSDPWDALRAFRSQPERFDVVITDLSMPGMSGFDLAQSVLAARADTPIVMTSGFLREEDHRRAAQIGIRALIFKPNTVDALAPVVHQLVSDRRRFDLP